jgi:hypothetical protein
MRWVRLFFRWLFSPWNIIFALLLVGVLGVRYLQTRPTALAIDPKLLQAEDRTKSRLQLELYFVTPDAQSFAVEKRDAGLELDDVTTRAVVAMKNYLAGPTLEGATALVKDLSTPTVFAFEQTVFIDLPADWQQIKLGTQGELLLLCGITNTMLGLKDVQSVRFLLLGKPAPTVAGHIPTDKPFTNKECGS